ncbi:MAG TPA: hypothetical protein VG992_03940, partial [Candidatus Saccharimonadales bacterium]|nr:hypothetical protein [Candidatus Saccharimonadales bacterium]
MRVHFRRISGRIWLGLLLPLCISSTAIAATANTPTSTAKKSGNTTSNTNKNSDLTSTVTQSYNADVSVQPGMIVQLKDKDPNTVTPLPADNIKALLGVVVPPNNATIVLTPEHVTVQQVLVATSGHYSVLVSNQNGPIKTGDYITISAIAGVGMKADSSQTEVIGKAAGSFSGTANVISSVSLHSDLGKATTVSIGRVPVDLIISHNPLYQKSADLVPTFLVKFATG